MTKRLCVVCRQRPGWRSLSYVQAAKICNVCLRLLGASGEPEIVWAANRAWRYAKAEAKKKARKAR